MLASLNEQSDPYFDLIVFNDGLCDASDICSQFLNRPTKIIDIKGTIPEIRSQGLSHLKQFNYENVIFGDADDVFSNCRVEVSKKLLRNFELVVNDVDVCRLGSVKNVPKYFQKRLQSNTTYSWHAIKDYNFIGFSNSSMRISNIPEIVFENNLIAVDWAFFTTVMLKGIDAYFTADTTTSYLMHCNNHYDIMSKTVEAYFYKAKVRSAHYRHLCKNGLGFEEEYEIATALCKQADDEEMNCQLWDHLLSDSVEHPFWWELNDRKKLEMGT